jgi:hypothetical protein
VTWLTIRFLGLIGLARRIATPSPLMIAGAALGRLETRGDPGVPDI